MYREATLLYLHVKCVNSAHFLLCAVLFQDLNGHGSPQFSFDFVANFNFPPTFLTQLENASRKTFFFSFYALPTLSQILSRNWQYNYCQHVYWVGRIFQMLLGESISRYVWSRDSLIQLRFCTSAVI